MRCATTHESEPRASQSSAATRGLEPLRACLRVNDLEACVCEQLLCAEDRVSKVVARYKVEALVEWRRPVQQPALCQHLREHSDGLDRPVDVLEDLIAYYRIKEALCAAHNRREVAVDRALRLPRDVRRREEAFAQGAKGLARR